jgi:hypothetical protein
MDMTKLLKYQPILTIVLLAIIITSVSSRAAAHQDTPPNWNVETELDRCNPENPTDIINIVDAGWSNYSYTSDCAQGWGVDEWHLTLTQPKTVRLRVEDCCCPGDYYGIYVNGNRLGTTPKPASWGCGQSGALSSGTFDIFLPTGTHVLKIRDVSFTEHTAAEIANAFMCPAGFTFSGTLLTPPSRTDISLDAASWEFTNNTSPYQPEKFWVSIMARNLGTVETHNVVVRFYLGNPDQGGVQIGSDQVISSIAVNGQAISTVEWTMSGNIENQQLYARVFADLDSDLDNNTTSKTVSVWYIPFKHDVDSYSFGNWSLDWTDVVNDLLMFLDIYHPDDMASAIMYPIIYPFWSMILESGGHCYGMAATSSLYYQFPNIKPVPKTTYAMSRDEARSDIQNYHRTQTTSIFDVIMMSSFGSNPVTEYESVLSSLRDQHKPIMLLMQTSDGGHAVLAYKVLDLGDEKRIYMYDNNLPLNSMNRSLYATVNTRNRTFLYASPYGYNFDRFLARPALLTWPDNSQVILQRFYNWVLREILQNGLIRVSIGPSISSARAAQASIASPTIPTELVADPLITDQFGRRIGYDNGTQLNEIPGATLLVIGDQKVIDLPSDLEYSIRATGNASGNIALSFLIPENNSTIKEVGFFEIPVLPGSIASVQLKKGNPDWTLDNTGQPPKQPDSLMDTVLPNLYLPLINGKSACAGQKISNPGFEGTSVGWNTSSSTGRSLITSDLPSSVAPYNGEWAAWLGYNYNETSLVSQTILLNPQVSSATLTYWYWIDSEESQCTYDHAWLELNGGLMRLYFLCSDGNTFGWVQENVDLTPYLGQPLTIQFHVDTDSIIRSSFYIDDVLLDVSCTEQ